LPRKELEMRKEIKVNADCQKTIRWQVAFEVVQRAEGIKRTGHFQKKVKRVCTKTLAYPYSTPF